MEIEGLFFIGKLDIDLYKCITDDISTEDVIITGKQIEHIDAKHSNAYEKYGNYIPEIIADPDYIIESPKYGTGIVMKEIQKDNLRLKLVLRIATSFDNPLYKNSIITFMRVRKQDWDRIVRNKNILYRKK